MTHLVASSVPDLAASDVSVTDSSGRLLTADGTGAGTRPGRQGPRRARDDAGGPRDDDVRPAARPGQGRRPRQRRDRHVEPHDRQRDLRRRQEVDRLLLDRRGDLHVDRRQRRPRAASSPSSTTRPRRSTRRPRAPAPSYRKAQTHPAEPRVARGGAPGRRPGRRQAPDRRRRRRPQRRERPRRRRAAGDGRQRRRPRPGPRRHHLGHDARLPAARPRPRRPRTPAAGGPEPDRRARPAGARRDPAARWSASACCAPSAAASPPTCRPPRSPPRWTAPVAVPPSPAPRRPRSRPAPCPHRASEDADLMAALDDPDEVASMLRGWLATTGDR